MLNAQSVGNKAATISRTIVDDRIDTFVITETWHENSQLTTLSESFHLDTGVSMLLDRYHLAPPTLLPSRITAASTSSSARRKLSTSASQPSSIYVVLCRLVLVTWCCLVSTDRRPGSQALSEVFFDELSAVFEQLSVSSRRLR